MTQDKRDEESSPTQTESEVKPIENHPLAGVIGSFAHDLPTLDAIMAGAEDYRRRMEADENVP